MVFSKTFPRNVEGSNYPKWEEVFLTEEEEKIVEEECRKENFKIMSSCLEEARAMAINKRLNTDENVVQIARALFEKRASHVIFWKESKAKEKFDVQFNHK